MLFERLKILIPISPRSVNLFVSENLTAGFRNKLNVDESDLFVSV